MNYVYDILLNFHKVDYDFFDWNLNDDIIHVRKIPLIKVCSNCLNKIIYYECNVPIEFLKHISNRTEIFSHKNIRIEKYLCLFSDGKDVLGISFNNSGKKEKISRLLIDEKEEILSVTDNIHITKLDITFFNKIKVKEFRTRREQEMFFYIKRQFQKKNHEKLKYIYLECFNEEENNYDKIIKRLNDELSNNWSNCYEKIYNIFRLSSMKISKKFTNL